MIDQDPSMGEGISNRCRLLSHYLLYSTRPRYDQRYFHCEAHFQHFSHPISELPSIQPTIVRNGSNRSLTFSFPKLGPSYAASSRHRTSSAIHTSVQELGMCASHATLEDSSAGEISGCFGTISTEISHWRATRRRLDFAKANKVCRCRY